MVFARWTPVLVVAAVCVAQVVADDTPHCNITVSAGDAVNGLKVVTDPRCATGGDGCIDTVCRHCIATPPSTDYPTYPNCSDIVDVEETNEDDGSADTDDSSQADDGSGATEHDLPDNLEAESPVSGASYGCPYPTSGGDFDVGIQLVGDATCNQGGLGCFANVCRFCKFKETNQSSHLFTCDSLGYTIHVPVVETVLPPANPDTGCPFNVSSGDFAVGVQLVGDPSCINGGIGCYQDICRFCKFQETPQSANWRNCSDFGYPHTPAPTFAPASIDDNGVWDGSTGCAYAVSSGDFAVGVQLVGDTSCASGGLGCFGNTCRFCQFRPTLQSQHMVSCASLGYPRSQQPIGTPQDIADPITGCPFPVSSGDFAAGIQLVGDTSCTKGGLGCYNNVCRFCKFKETPQSTNWVPCANYSYPPVAPPVIQVANIEPSVDYGTGCPYPVTSGDYNVGIQLVGDDSCVKGGIGCYKDVCRFCKFQNTNQSAAFVDCSTLGWPRTVTPVAKPADIPVENPATGCPYPVSSGDFAVGIQLVGDASCVKGGLGCYKNVCRFCKFHETVQSSGFVACEDLGYGAIFTPATVDTNTTSTNCPYPVSSGDYDAGIHLVGDTSCSEGGVGCYKDVCRFCKFRDSPQSGAFVNCEDLGYFFGSNADAILPAPPSSGPSTQCPYPTSIGDLAVGVLLVGDAKCATGGIGCFKNVCRYCQFVPTDKSNNFVTCTSLGYNYSIPAMPMKPAPTTPPTLPPTTTPPPPPPTTAAPTLPVCPYAVSPGDFAVGINLVGDPTCAAGGIGCYQNVCRFCKFNETVQAANFVPCANYSQVVAAPAEIVVTTPPPTTAAPPKPPVCAKVCDLPLAPGDRNVGVGLVTDYSCLISGLGCIKDSVCRFCRVTRTAKSNHLNPCSKYGSFGTTVTQPPKTQAPAVTPTTQPPAIAVVPTVDPGTTPVATASTVVPGATPPALVVAPAVPPASATASDSTVVPPLPATSNASDTGAASVVPVVAPVVPGVAPANPTAPVSGTVSDSAVAPPAQGSAPAVVPSAPVAGTAIDPAGAPASPASATTSDSGTVPLNPVVPATGTATDPAGAPASPASATTSDSGTVPVNPVVPSAGTTSDSAVVPPVAGPAVVPSSPASATASDSAPAPIVPVGSSTDPAVVPVVVAPPLRLAMKEKNTSFTEIMNKLFEDDIFKWSASAAACVGVVAIVAVVAIGTKRLVTHRRQSVATIEDEEASTQEELDIPTKTKSPIDEEEKV